MDQGPKEGRLSRRQRRDLARLEQELVADVHLCRWFDRLASGELPPAPDEARTGVACSRAGRSVGRSSQFEQAGAVTWAMFAALVVAAAVLTMSDALLQAPVLAVLAMIVFRWRPCPCSSRTAATVNTTTRPNVVRDRAAAWSASGLVRWRAAEPVGRPHVVAVMTRPTIARSCLAVRTGCSGNVDV